MVKNFDLGPWNQSKSPKNGVNSRGKEPGLLLTEIKRQNPKVENEKLKDLIKIIIYKRFHKSGLNGVWGLPG